MFKNQAEIKDKLTEAADAVASASRALIAVAVVAVAALALSVIALLRTFNDE